MSEIDDLAARVKLLERRVERLEEHVGIPTPDHIGPDGLIYEQPDKQNDQANDRTQLS